MSKRTAAPEYEVSFEWGRANPGAFPQDDAGWVEVLRHPPESWSAAEVAHWARRPREQGGGALGALMAERLWENAIDGHLLLMFGNTGGGGGGGPKNGVGTGGTGAVTGAGAVMAGELVRVLGVTTAKEMTALSKVGKAIHRLWSSYVLCTTASCTAMSFCRRRG
ncbi:hypothetical protein VaNZ11_002728, partial [Volvox africanus]